MADTKDKKDVKSSTKVYTISNLAFAFKNASKFTQDFSNFKGDDIVDDSHFKRSSEIKRDMIASGNIGAGERGVYDFNEGEKVTKDNLLSDVEIALRSGKLDKADIQKLQELYKQKAETDVAEAREIKALEDEKQAQTNRLSELDKSLGVNQNS